MVTHTRARYLFDLAAVTCTPPAAVNGLTLVDFALLVAGIDARHAANTGPER
jgi:hypothetical protein